MGYHHGVAQLNIVDVVVSLSSVMIPFATTMFIYLLLMSTFQCSNYIVVCAIIFQAKIKSYQPWTAATWELFDSNRFTFFICMIFEHKKCLIWNFQCFSISMTWVVDEYEKIAHSVFCWQAENYLNDFLIYNTQQTQYAKLRFRFESVSNIHKKSESMHGFLLLPASLYLLLYLYSSQ